MVREEGHYTIKRVDVLPKRGNANFLYALKESSLGEFYRWLPNNTYETITIGGASTDQDNVARVIEVTNIDIDPFPGMTVEEQIVQYINSLSYEKLDTDAEIWINYTDLGIVLTGFSSSASPTLVDVCTNSPEEATVTYYHNGESSLPQNGDSVFLDSEGNFTLEPGWYSDGLSWYFVDLEGLVNRTLNCE